MADRIDNERINSLLVNVSRSFLQYVAQCWPWTGSAGESTRQVIHRLADDQSIHVGLLYDLLIRRAWPVDAGVYPTEYTDLHYVALEFLLDELVANERSVVAAVERLAAEAPDDDESAPLLQQMLTGERRILDTLLELRTSATAGESTLSGA